MAKRRRIRRSGLTSSEDSSSSDNDDKSSSGEDADDLVRPTGRNIGEKYKIPKLPKLDLWTDIEIENFRKNWPHLRNFEDSTLKKTSFKNLAGVGKSNLLNAKVTTSRLAENYNHVVSFPVQIEAGPDDCVGKAHNSRFIRGYVADHQELWVQARSVIGLDGLDPITNYELLSTGMGDLLTQRVWEEAHKPNSRLLSIRMLSAKSVEEALRLPDKTEAPKEFETLQELKLAMATLETIIHKVMPWNMSFKTLSLFFVLNDFGASELSGKKQRLSLIAVFVDEVLRTNARNWEEKKKYVSYQELCAKWSAFLSRNQLLMQGGEGGKDPGKKKEKSTPALSGKRPKVPGWICRKFNIGDCDVKEGKHPSSWDPNYLLKHVCSKLDADGRYCGKSHTEKDHK